MEGPCKEVGCPRKGCGELEEVVRVREGGELFFFGFGFLLGGWWEVERERGGRGRSVC